MQGQTGNHRFAVPVREKGLTSYKSTGKLRRSDIFFFWRGVGEGLVKSFVFANWRGLVIN